MWKGAVNFGLINVPIKMFTATENNNISFKSLHKECHTPIKQKRYCTNCEKEVDYNDIVKGYEYQKDSYVSILGQILYNLYPQAHPQRIQELYPLFLFSLPKITSLHYYSYLINKRQTNSLTLSQITIALLQLDKDYYLYLTFLFIECK